MNRRTLLTSFALALAMPAIARAEMSSPQCGTAFRNFQHHPVAGAGRASLSVEVKRQGGLVAPLPTADEIMASVVESGHEHAGLEFYIIAQDTPPPPALDLDAIVVTWTSLEGAAAVRRDGAIAMLQDGGTRWKISTTGGDASAHVDLLDDVATVVSRLHDEAGTDLLDLLPSEDDLWPGWELVKERCTPETCER